MNFDNIEPKDRLWLLLIVLILTVEFVMIVGGAVLKIKERHFYGRRTKKYLSEEYESILHSEYPCRDITLEEKNIRKKELRKLCASCIQDLSQLTLYSAGTLSKAFGTCLVNVRIFAAVKPSYYRENSRSADTYEDTEYYTWLIFDVRPLYLRERICCKHDILMCIFDLLLIGFLFKREPHRINPNSEKGSDYFVFYLGKAVLGAIVEK